MILNSNFAKISDQSGHITIELLSSRPPSGGFHNERNVLQNVTVEVHRADLINVKGDKLEFECAIGMFDPCYVDNPEKFEDFCIDYIDVKERTWYGKVKEIRKQAIATRSYLTFKETIPTTIVSSNFTLIDNTGQ